MVKLKHQQKTFDPGVWLWHVAHLARGLAYTKGCRVCQISLKSNAKEVPLQARRDIEFYHKAQASGTAGLGLEAYDEHMRSSCGHLVVGD